MRFIERYACRSGIHCATCRRDPAWRAEQGAPDRCYRPRRFIRQLGTLNLELRTALRPGTLAATAIKLVAPSAAESFCASCSSTRAEMNTAGWLGCWRQRRALHARFTAAARLHFNRPDLTLAPLIIIAIIERIAHHWRSISHRRPRSLTT